MSSSRFGSLDGLLQKTSVSRPCGSTCDFCRLRPDSQHNHEHAEETEHQPERNLAVPASDLKCVGAQTDKILTHEFV